MTTDAEAVLLLSAYQMGSKSVRVLFRERSLSILLDATVAKFVEGSHLKLESASGEICNRDLARMPISLRRFPRGT